jgi:2'-hydroxyisoflavone reductase
MSFSRRDLLRATALGLASAACSSSSTSTKSAPIAAPTPPKKKRILILGGTGFLGPKTIDVAVARGHSVTIFNRGKREKFLPLEATISRSVEHLYGNRDPDKPADEEKGPDGTLLHPDSPKGLEQLVGKSFDTVIDNSGYIPRHVAASAQLLAKNGAARYIFISSISAYDEASIPATGGDEKIKLATLSDPTVEEMGKEFQNYGGLKVLCEKAAQAAFPQGATIVRPGYIVGPGDPTDRFTYWPMRIKAGGDVLAPGAPDDPLQWIDVRDLAEWLIALVENDTVGEFNAVNPPTPARWGDVLQTCVDTAASGAKLEWVPQSFLESSGMGEDGAFPIWTAPVGKYAGFHRWSNERARSTGLTFRPTAETIKSILDWYPKEVERRVRVTKELAAAAEAKGQPAPKGDPSALRAGPPAEKEKELLEKWRAAKPK